MSKNLRNEMPWVASLVDDLREAFGKDAIDTQIRAGIKGAPTFWAREGGREIGTRSMVQTYAIYWDEHGISRTRPADWMLDARQQAKAAGIEIAQADVNDDQGMEREAVQLRKFIGQARNKASGQ